MSFFQVFSLICFICETEERFVKLQCGHELHEECWNQDKEKRNKGCMYCRQGGEQPKEPSLFQLLLLAGGGGGGGGGSGLR